MSKLKCKRTVFIILTLIVSMISACGGGGGSDNNNNSNKNEPDTTAPVITLNGEEQVDAEVLVPFVDPGASATDETDGSVPVVVTGSVDANTAGDYTLTYTATDASGNTATLTRVVSVADRTPPEITLLDKQEFVLEQGEEYLEPGATALDNVDGEVDISLSSNIDYDAVGQYQVVYTATDSVGNVSTTTRVVSVTSRKHKLIIDQFGEGEVTVVEGPALDCSDAFDCVVEAEETENIILEASPTAPWVFKSWRGCDEVEGLSESQCSVTLEKDTVVSLTLSPNENDFDYSLGDDVIELDDLLKSQIIDYNAETGVITFSQFADLSALQPGSILVSNGIVGGDGVRTQYFLKRVEKIVGNNQSLKVVKTSEASITDFVEEGVFVWQQALTASDVDASSLPQGLQLKPSNSSGAQKTADTSDPIEFLASGLVLYDDDGNVSTKHDQISLNGGIKLFVNPDFALDIDFPFTVEEFRSILYVDLNTDATLTVGGLVNLAEKKLPALSLKFSVIPLGPLIIVPTVDLNIVYQAGAGGVIKPTITAKTDIVAGARYRSELGWDGVSDLDFDVGVNNWTELVDFKAEATLGPEIAFVASLYGVLGPKINAKGVVGVEALPLIDNEKCILDVNTFMEATAGFGANFKVLTKRFDYTVDLIKYKRLINDYSRECGTGKPAAPTELTVEQGPDSSLQLDWLAVGDGAEITYKIARDNIVTVSDILASDYLDERLTIGNEYCYVVYATDDAGNESDPSDRVCATVTEPDTEAPTIPSSVVATPLSSTAIKLNWEASTDNVAVEGYTVYQVFEGLFLPKLIVAKNEVDVLRLESNTEYCFVVSSYDAEGNVSDYSTQACATTLSSESAKWTMFSKCSDRSNYVVEDSFDLDEGLTEDIFVFGEANDYDGTPMYYNLFGTYNNVTKNFNGEINWSFEGSTQLRKDVFTADLSLSDTGDISMNQVQVTGCDADIRFVNQSVPAEKPVYSKGSFGTGLGTISGN